MSSEKKEGESKAKNWGGDTKTPRPRERKTGEETKILSSKKSDFDFKSF
jgi:hypothetical protein